MAGSWLTRSGPLRGMFLVRFSVKKPESHWILPIYSPPTRPGKIICVGRNYAAHAKEHDVEIPDVPLIFLKPPSSLIGTTRKSYFLHNQPKSNMKLNWLLSSGNLVAGSHQKMPFLIFSDIRSQMMSPHVTCSAAMDNGPERKVSIHFVRSALGLKQNLTLPML